MCNIFFYGETRSSKSCADIAKSNMTSKKFPVWSNEELCLFWTFVKFICNQVTHIITRRISRGLLRNIWISVVKLIPFMDDKAILRLENGKTPLVLEPVGRWRLKSVFFTWSSKINQMKAWHFRLYHMLLCLNFNKKKTLPLIYWEHQTFEAIRTYFGGLAGISIQTLNLLDSSCSFIEVKRNHCGFLLT